jgi:hypothetical protein
MVRVRPCVVCGVSSDSVAGRVPADGQPKSHTVQQASGIKAFIRLKIPEWVLAAVHQGDVKPFQALLSFDK